MDFIKNLPEGYKGFVLFVVGLILLFHLFGFFVRGFLFIEILITIFLLVVGFLKMDGVNKTKKLIAQFKK